MHHNLHTTARPRALFRAAAPELSYQDYLRISQSARARALAARRETSQAFWAGAARLMRQAVGSLTQHASVRLGAGHRVVHAGA
jgi:hypothetical protein